MKQLGRHFRSVLRLLGFKIERQLGDPIPTTRHWRTLEDGLDYYRKEGYVVGYSKCPICNEVFVNAVEPNKDGTAPKMLECSRCKKITAEFTPYAP